MGNDSYLTIKAFSQGIYKEKGSRFIGLAYPVNSQDEIKSIIDKIRKVHHSARHHCFAWVIGQDRLTHRANDDGEPSGSAGRHIMRQINKYGLTNILVVVVRYFGGKLLGINGLAKAYRSAAETAIKNSEIIKVNIKDYFELVFPYSCLNDVMKIIKDEAIVQSSPKFELECRLIINFRASLRANILSSLDRIDGLSYTHLYSV
jgi:uncharacterized YigZ family protein